MRKFLCESTEKTKFSEPIFFFRLWRKVERIFSLIAQKLISKQYGQHKFTNQKIFLYARKSTDEPERQVLSIEAQMFELREYAKKENLNIVREFVESKTAKEPGREIFNEMIASIEKK